jgi:hypothetical protein
MHEEYKEIIKKSIEYIENHLHEELTTEEWHLTVQYRCTIFIASFKDMLG